MNIYVIIFGVQCIHISNISLKALKKDMNKHSWKEAVSTEIDCSMRAAMMWEAGKLWV